MFDLSWITKILSVLTFLSTFFKWLETVLPTIPT